MAGSLYTCAGCSELVPSLPSMLQEADCPSHQAGSHTEPETSGSPLLETLTSLFLWYNCENDLVFLENLYCRVCGRSNH